MNPIPGEEIPRPWHPRSPTHVSDNRSHAPSNGTHSPDRYRHRFRASDTHVESHTRISKCHIVTLATHCTSYNMQTSYDVHPHCWGRLLSFHGVCSWSFLCFHCGSRAAGAPFGPTSSPRLLQPMETPQVVYPLPSAGPSRGYGTRRCCDHCPV